MKSFYLISMSGIKYQFKIFLQTWLLFRIWCTQSAVDNRKILSAIFLISQVEYFFIMLMNFENSWESLKWTKQWIFSHKIRKRIGRLGFCEQNKTIYEFNGCIFHGCQKCDNKDGTLNLYYAGMLGVPGPNDWFNLGLFRRILELLLFNGIREQIYSTSSMSSFSIAIPLIFTVILNLGGIKCCKNHQKFRKLDK